MTDALAAGDRVKIRSFRSIHDKEYKGYKVTNSNTRESVQVSPKKPPFFKCGQELKERVDDIQTSANVGSTFVNAVTVHVERIATWILK